MVSIIAEWALVLTIAATFVAALTATWRSLPPGGRGPFSARWRGPALVGCALALVVVGELRLLDARLQDRAAENTATAGYEQTTGRTVQEVRDVLRLGSCAVVWLTGRDTDALPEEDTTVIVTRANDRWRVAAISAATGDADEFYDEADCLDHATDAP